MDDQLKTAIARLEEFVSTYPEGDLIDGDMDLTVDDVRQVIAAAKAQADMVSIPYGTLDDLAKLRDYVF